MQQKTLYIDCISYEGALFEKREKIDMIKESYKEIGYLIHPIVVKEGSTPGNYDLITGRARLAALKELEQRQINCLVAPKDIKKEDAKRIALHENIKRENIQWYDQIQLESEFHQMRIDEKGQQPKGRISGQKEGWSLRDTAAELDIALGTLSQDINLAKAVQLNPSLKNIKDKNTALKLVKLQAKTQIAEAEAAIPTDFNMNQVLLGDSSEILKHFPPMLFDVCITDPPWSEYSDKKLTEDEFTLPVFKEVYRLLKPESFLYCILSSTDFQKYKEFLESLNFKVQKYPVIWKKLATITHGRRPWEYARDYEVILVAVKGNPTLKSLQEHSAIIETKTLHHSAMIHPHEKHPDLIAILLERCSYEGSKVIDPFGGSGVVAEVCSKMSRPFITVERNPEFYNNIVKRLEKTK